MKFVKCRTLFFLQKPTETLDEKNKQYKIIFRNVKKLKKMSAKITFHQNAQVTVKLELFCLKQ